MRRGQLRRRWVTSTVLVLSLAGCGGVVITPDPVLPKALVEPIPARVGLLLTAEQKSFVHSETRHGVTWEVALGTGQQRLVRTMFSSIFGEVQEFAELDSARKTTGLQAIFEPKIEQYSFATAQETGGEYVAVSIRYRIDVRTANGERYDSLTLTGYGTAMADGFGSSAPIEAATLAAKRDAAAKFLTQVGGLPLVKELSAGRPLQAVPEAAAIAAVSVEALPIRASRRSSSFSPLSSLPAQP
ncbi:MAG: hypothetical protein RLZZ33_1367 [Pseudomonadota bacterium]|jgi:hypothetical protein